MSKKLRGFTKQIRQLKRENNRLRKTVGRQENLEYVKDEYVELEEEETEFEPCPECGHPLKELDLNIRAYAVCDECGFRKKIK